MSSLLQALSIKFCVVGVVDSIFSCSCSMACDVQYVFLQLPLYLKFLVLWLFGAHIAMAFQLFLPPSVLHRIGAFLPYDQLHIYGEGHDITPFYNPLGFLYNRADWQAQILA